MKNLIIFILVLMASILISCSPQTTEPINLPPAVPPADEIDVVENPCITFDEVLPTMREDIENAYVIYRDYMRSKDYDSAYEIWQKAFYAAPAANGKVSYQFDDGILLYRKMYEKATTDDEKNTAIDSAFAVYDKWIECYPDQEATVLGKKAFNAYYTFRGRLSDDEIYDLFKRAYDGKEEPDYFIVNPFTKVLFDRVLAEKVSYEEGSAYALSIIDLVADNLSDCKGKECETWGIINDYAPGLLSSLEGLKGFYPCDYFISRYFSEYEADPSNCDVITDTYRKLKFGQCDSDNPKMITLQNAYTSNCYTPPPASGPLKLGREALDGGRFKEAIGHYETFISSTSDIKKKADIQLRIAKIYYVHIKNFPKARRFALDAAKSRANWGAPYMLIGKLYASSGPLCGPGRGWDSQIVTWPAIDKFEYAKSIDPSVSGEASKLINEYKKYMPSKEDIFIRRISEGDTFTVPCWIQEKTEVRAAG